ncbi:hypothetical protein CEXT_397641 [Caerostris extrusa]|uniref:Uncharacterized protein n=1 Tax=Caerostris extrusa TaxID=172846 RepID=A0AAV4N036_CAEEX|nr:hypothetical protein CEXT_397641 [Caerostris extrusa]
MECEFLRLKLFYSDMHNVPRNHLRSVSWNAYVIRDHPSTGTKESVIVLNAPTIAITCRMGWTWVSSWRPTYPSDRETMESSVICHGVNTPKQIVDLFMIGVGTTEHRRER